MTIDKHKKSVELEIRRAYCMFCLAPLLSVQCAPLNPLHPIGYQPLRLKFYQVDPYTPSVETSILYVKLIASHAFCAALSAAVWHA